MLRLTRHISEEHKRRISLKLKDKKRPDLIEKIGGSKNPGWKGDNVSYITLHKWIRNHLPKPELCQICKKLPPKQLSNISGKYKRDVTDYQWVCIRCHMVFDDRLEPFMKLNKGRKHSDESRKRMGLAFKGKKLTDSHRRKVSLGLKRMWATGKRKGNSKLLGNQNARKKS